MVRRSTFLALALVAAFAVAGCGEDNNDNKGPGTTSTPAVTPVVTVTPTPTQVGNETPTQTPVGGETPTPTPTPTGGACEADQMVLTITSAAGSDLDTGLTGISHNAGALEQATVSIDLNDCADGECTVDGSALVGTRFGSPLPLAAGGVGSCVTNTFRAPVTGTYNCATGCGVSDVRLTSSVFLAGGDLAKPCPLCLGDPTPNDGQKDGRCDRGSNDNAACDVGGISRSLGGSPILAPTSNDCPPSGSSTGDLEINLVPLTTGTVTTTPGLTCADPEAGICYCPGQNRPNQCLDEVCTVDAGGNGICATGPVVQFCSQQAFRRCRAMGTLDCEDTYPGAGTCEVKLSPCFGTSISRTGQCGITSGTLAAVFCIPKTDTAPAINITSGLPGPGALTLPVTSVRRPR